MTGYTRQSIADIVPGADVDAAPLNDEFNALQDAFNSTTGHSHDGSSGNGPKVGLTTSVSGVLPIANGGTNAPNASDARTNLGLAIGTNVQAYDAGLQSISGLTTAANNMIYTTALDVYATTSLTSAARSLLADATVPRLSTNNTWSGNNIFGGSVNRINNVAPVLELIDTGSSANHTISAVGGYMNINCDVNSVIAGPEISVKIQSTEKMLITKTATTFNDDVALASNKAISFAGTGAATTRTNLGLGTAATVNTGTSGATVPLLNGANTWSGIQTFGTANGVFVTSVNPAINLTDTDTGVDHAISANSGVGNLSIQCDVNSEGSSPQLIMSVKGTNKMLLSETGISVQVPINMASNQAISFAGTGAATTRTNLGLGTAATVNTGTTGATIPLLDASNTWSNQQTFSSGIAFGSGNDDIIFNDTTNTFTFRADSASTASKILAGTYYSNEDDDPAWSVNTDSIGASLGQGLLTSSRGSAVPLILKRMTSNGDIIEFRQTGTTKVGSVSITASATAYNTSSDIRLKYDFQPINPDLLDQIKVYDFGWKNGDGRAYGVIAQELVDVIPQAVNKGETEEDMWSVDYSKLVPLLIATVQELKKEVAELKEKLNG